jgi:hypothetical protein
MQGYGGGIWPRLHTGCLIPSEGTITRKRGYIAQSVNWLRDRWLVEFPTGARIVLFATAPRPAQVASNFEGLNFSGKAAEA